MKEGERWRQERIKCYAHLQCGLKSAENRQHLGFEVRRSPKLVVAADNTLGTSKSRAFVWVAQVELELV
jgi:hypothetical protein